MSSASGRYQSRLFNFIHKQSRHFTQKCDRALGHLRVSTSWLGAIGLYPLYLLFQSTGSVVKQLYQAVQQLPQLPPNNPPQITTPPTSETPIKQVLLYVSTPSEEAFLNAAKTESSNFLAFLALWRFKSLPNNSKNPFSLTHPSISIHHPDIQGIATQLSSRNLVLVTKQNEILDIFTFQQQQKLQERIIDEVAQYWRYQRLHSIEPLTNKLLPPVSLSSMIAKVQGIIAPNNIFQRSSLVKRQEKGSYAQRAIIFLDSTVATLESQQFAPVSIALSVRQYSWEVVKLVQTRLSQNLLSIDSRDNKSLATTLNKFNPLAPELNYHKIQSLILAAINYFFGVSDQQPKVTSTPTASVKLSASSTQAKLRHYGTLKLPASAASTNLASADADPWLTLGDLFGEPLASEAATLPKSLTSQVAGKNILLPASQLPKYSLRNLLHRFQMSLAKQPGGVQHKNSTGIGEVEQQLPPLLQSASVNAGVTARSQDQIEAQPDWIETDATAIGYVKHPLEQLLQWLDLTLLWLEEMVLKVLQWLQRLWQGK